MISGIPYVGTNQPNECSITDNPYNPYNKIAIYKAIN
jgi:hypothetical protein